MKYVYHAVPANLEGDYLHPLFKLKDLFPQAYTEEIKKYNDHPQRKLLPYKIIPKLNCKRGDVLHCSSVHPNLVFNALKQVFPDGVKSNKFYKIPLSSLHDNKLALFDMNRPEYEFGLEKDPDSCFDIINPELYEELSVVPEEAIEFYIEWKNKGALGAPAWGKIPHVFIQGSVCIADLEIIDWCDSIPPKN